MRLALILALAAVSAGALVAPKHVAIPLPGVGALRAVAGLLDCDAHVIAQIGSSPASVRSDECTGQAHQLAAAAHGGR